MESVSESDEARVRGKVLKGEGVEQPEHERSGRQGGAKSKPRCKRRRARSLPFTPVQVPIARSMLHPTRLLAWAALLGGGVRNGLAWASHHTGLPVIVVAAIALVASWHIFKRTVRFALEVALAVAVLLVATRLGLLSW